MTYDIVFLTPDAESANALNDAYRHRYDHEPNRKVRAFSIYTNPGGGTRYGKMVVMPVPHWAAPEVKDLHEIAVRTHSTRLTPTGQVIRL